MKAKVETGSYQPQAKGLLLLQCIVAAFFCIFAARFWYLQIHKGDNFIIQARENRLREELIYAMRGILYDSNGQMLAENRVTLGIGLVKDNCPDVPAALAQVSEWLNVPLEYIQARYQRERKNVHGNEPVLLMGDIPFEKIAIIEAKLLDWPGLQIINFDKRHYPFAGSFAHILGYVAGVNRQDMEKNPNLSMHDSIGRQGLEYVLDKRLRGRNGMYFAEADSLGRILSRTVVRPPLGGETVALNIDSRLQQAIVDILGEQTGSVVVMEPHSGAVRALVTTPAYDNNLFIGGMPAREWNELRENPKLPLLNRAIQSVYPPGSVWKLMMAGLFLSKGISPDNRVLCTGEISLGDHVFRCWRKGGHGYVDMKNSLVHSCDVYYYTMGAKLGIDNIANFAKACGFGATTGIELPHEKAGLVPSRAWKRRRFKDSAEQRWQRGETLNVSIGQGYTLATPLQIASFISALLNGGKLMEPHIVADSVPRVRGEIPLDEANRKFIVDAMQATVESAGATARVLKRSDAIIGGKTGTAQVVKLRMVGDRRLKASEVPYFERDHAWMASWGERNGKKVVVVAMIEHGGGGSSVAGPVVKKVYDAISALEDSRPLPVFQAEAGQ